MGVIKRAHFFQGERSNVWKAGKVPGVLGQESSDAMGQHGGDDIRIMDTLAPQIVNFTHLDQFSRGRIRLFVQMGIAQEGAA